MSGVINPVGPEEPATYWVRRALVAVVAVVAVVIGVSLVTGGSNGQRATPAAGAVTESPSAPGPTTPTASSTLTKSSAAAATSSSRTAFPTGSPSAAATKSATTKPTSSPKPTAEATAKTTPTAKAGPVACQPEEMRVTLTGEQTLKPKEKNTFKLSVINGGAVPCRLAINGKNFELKIYSGVDRIWTTDDCSTAVKPISTTLGVEESVKWTMSWDGRRSLKNCKQRSEIPRPGTYFATAQLKDAKPVQLRMTLK